MVAEEDRGAFCMQLQAMEFMAEHSRGLSLKMKGEVQGFKSVPREVKWMPREAVVDGCGCAWWGRPWSSLL